MIAPTHLVQILLPVRGKEGGVIERAAFERVASELTERFGGVTAFDRAPAEGRWKDGGGTEHDEIVVVEVMVEGIDRAFWSDYRADLERRFRQDVVIIRAQETRLL